MDNVERLAQYCGERGIWWERDGDLSRRCTFKIGGRAALVAEPASEEEIAGLAAEAARLEAPLLVLGKGSNVLFSDSGYPGLVLCLGLRFARMELGEDGILRCQSGASLSQLCLYALELGLEGLEFAYGIPGTVGGAVYMNAGAYGGEIRDVLAAASHVERSGLPGRLQGGELGLSYRHSAYQDTDRIITGAEFRLRPGNREEIKARMDDYLNRRRSKQPLDYPSAGSTFKRPQGDYASALIDRCGLKGRSVGGAQVSEKHAGFLINAGGATCGDVRALIALVQEEVLQQTGFRLECEVKIIS